MLRNRIVMIFIMIGMVFTFAGCESSAGTVEKGDVNTVLIQHELGEVEVKVNPSRVVVFDYGVLDIINVIEEDVIALPKKTLPEYLNKFGVDRYEDVGTLQEPNFERIYELSPDLIIISGRQQALYEEFSKIAPTVYLTIDGTNYMESFQRNLEIIRRIYDKEEVINTRLEKIRSEVEELSNNSVDNSLIVMANDGNLSVYGKESRFGIIHKEFGINPADENIETSNHGQSITFEYLLDINPEYMFVIDRAAVTGGEISAKQVLENEIVRMTDAYKNHNIVYLDAHTWYVSVGGFESTERMIEEIKNGIK